jgi:predicted PurR-regulated permease PerM
MIIKQKYYLIIIASLLIIGLVMYFVMSRQKNDLIDQFKKTLETEKQAAIKEQKEIIKKQEATINDLISENEKAKEKSSYWYNQAKSKNVNPSYDLNFMSAADIIAKSKYKPGE